MVEALLLLVEVFSPFDDPGLFEILSSKPLFRRPLKWKKVIELIQANLNDIAKKV